MGASRSWWSSITASKVALETSLRWWHSLLDLILLSRASAVDQIKERNNVTMSMLTTPWIYSFPSVSCHLWVGRPFETIQKSLLRSDLCRVPVAEDIDFERELIWPQYVAIAWKIYVVHSNLRLTSERHYPYSSSLLNFEVAISVLWRCFYQCNRKRKEFRAT